MAETAYTKGPCPRCGGVMPSEAHPGEYIGALSRWDNKTYVCSKCGEDEAMLQYRAAVSRPVAGRGERIRRAVDPVLGGVLWKAVPGDET